MSGSPDIDGVLADRIATDSRFAAISRAIAIETDLRDNETIKAILGAVWKDSVQAMEELAETSPADLESISLLLVKVKTQVYIRRTLNAIINQGRAAEASVLADDRNREAE